MELPFEDHDSYDVECDDVIIHHHTECFESMYRFESGKTFVEICKEMEFDKVGVMHISSI